MKCFFKKKNNAKRSQRELINCKMPVVTRYQAKRMEAANSTLGPAAPEPEAVQAPLRRRAPKPASRSNLSIREILAPMLAPKKSETIRNKKPTSGTSRLDKIRTNQRSWIEKREEILEQYLDTPICQFIRTMKTEQSEETVDWILTMLGRIKGTPLSYTWYMGCVEDRANMKILIKALKAACPNIQYKFYSCELYRNTYIKLEISWKEGEMSEAILNEYIFPQKDGISEHYYIDTHTLKY